MESFKNLNTNILNYPKNSGFLIAYSGGADSTALLHLFSKHKHIRAIHINHGINSQADLWQQHCLENCDKLGIELIVEKVKLKDTSENSCRKARYQCFEKHIKTNEILVTAHHQQDQAETVLLKLLRGTGANGLTGIDKIRRFAKGYLARPLLDYTADALKQYLARNNYTWIEDDSNAENIYRRNFIRNEILAPLGSRFPKAVENIARSANNIKQSLGLLDHLMSFGHKYLLINKFEVLPKSLHATLLYHWLSGKNIPVPDSVTLQQIAHDFINAKIDKTPHFQNKHYQLYRWQDAIYCVENYTVVDKDEQFDWNTQEVFSLPNGCGEITFSGDVTNSLSIRFNQKGEKIKTHKHQMTKSVKQLFQENSIPLWLRQITPYIYHQGKLVSLGFDWSHAKPFENTMLWHYKNFLI